MEIKPRFPEWVETWLDLPFYAGEKCKRHTKQYNTIYCLTCMEDPICDFCCKASDLHNGHPHQILRVSCASKRASVGVEDISKFVDVSEIQPYSINSKSIVFLNPQIERASDASQKSNCHTCQRSLIKSHESEEYKFCSIACKVQNNEREPQANMMINTTRNSDQYCCFVSLRKRSRKGIPHRAPLY